MALLSHNILTRSEGFTDHSFEACLSDSMVDQAAALVGCFWPGVVCFFEIERGERMRGPGSLVGPTFTDSVLEGSFGNVLVSDTRADLQRSPLVRSMWS